MVLAAIYSHFEQISSFLSHHHLSIHEITQNNILIHHQLRKASDVSEFKICLLFALNSIYRSLPKLSSQDEEGGAGLGFGGTHAHFEPIPHDHDFCERVVINVRINRLTSSKINHNEK